MPSDMEPFVYSPERVLFVHTCRSHCARGTAAADFFRREISFLTMGWESTPAGQGGPTLLSTAPFFFLYRDLPF